MRFRVGSVLAGALASGALLLALPMTALAAPCVPPLCQPTASPTPSPTPSATVDPQPTATHTMAPPPTRSSAPKPTTASTATATASATATSTDAVATTTEPTPSSSDVAVNPAEVSSEKSGGTTKLVVLILGGAVLLGIGGVSGLYLTRTPE